MIRHLPLENVIQSYSLKLSVLMGQLEVRVHTCRTVVRSQAMFLRPPELCSGASVAVTATISATTVSTTSVTFSPFHVLCPRRSHSQKQIRSSV